MQTCKREEENARKAGDRILAARWARRGRLVGALGAQGQSSDEDDELDVGGVLVKGYRTTQPEWRAPIIEDEFKGIDAATKQFEALSPRTKALPRFPTERKSKSAAPVGLPRCTYRASHLKRLEPRQQAELGIRDDIPASSLLDEGLLMDFSSSDSEDEI